MTVAIRNNPNQLPTDHEMMVYQTMAKQAVSSKMYRGIGDESGVMMIMLAARELAIPCMQALNGGLNIINGKVEISARMMSAMIRKAGHDIEEIEATSTICRLKGTRGDTGKSITVSFTVDEAKLAGIFKSGGGWTKWPEDMCWARALSRLARRLFSDVIGIGYVEGEIQDRDTRPSVDDQTDCHSVPAIEISVAPVDYLNQYLALFPLQEKTLALEYFSTVRDHFQWSDQATLTNLMSDEQRLMDKFNAWKIKHIETDNGPTEKV